MYILRGTNCPWEMATSQCSLTTGSYRDILVPHFVGLGDGRLLAPSSEVLYFWQANRGYPCQGLTELQQF